MVLDVQRRGKSAVATEPPAAAPQVPLSTPGTPRGQGVALRPFGPHALNASEAELMVAPRHLGSDRGGPSARVSAREREALPAAATATTAASDEERLRALFDYANKSKDGKISVKEMMVALRHDEGLAAVLHLPGHIHQEDGTRKAFESVFSALDSDGDRVITWDEFKTYFMAKHF